MLVDTVSGFKCVLGQMVKSFFDCVLVRAGKCRVDQIATVRTALRDLQLIAIFNGALDLVNVAEIYHRIDPLAK